MSVYHVWACLGLLAFNVGSLRAELPLERDPSPPVKLPVSSGGSTNAPVLRLMMVLSDGSRIVGVPTVIKLTAQTQMGDFSLDLALVQSIQRGPDRGAMVWRLKNGDQLCGSVKPDSLALNTCFGRVNAPLHSIERITVSLTGYFGSQHLIGWWKLNDGAGKVAADSSSDQDPHNGTLTNDPQWTTTDEIKSLQFGGGQFVSLGNILQGGYPEISIACWFKHKTSGWQNVVERGSWADADGIGLMMDYNGTSVSFGHYEQGIKSKSNVQDDRWHHVVGTIRPSGAEHVYSIYMDGRLDNTSTNTWGLTATKNPWAIGARYDGTWTYQGLLNDVRIYDSALTADDVQMIYNEGVDQQKAQAADSTR